MQDDVANDSPLPEEKELPADSVSQDAATPHDEPPSPEAAVEAGGDRPAGEEDAADLDMVLGYRAGDHSPDAPPDEGAPDREARDDLKAIIEALVFASPEPLTAKTLTRILDGEPKEDVEAAVTALQSDYQRKGGLQLVEVAGGLQIVTRPEFNDWVRRLFHERKTLRLSVQALETLAVIAYKQPITAPEVTEIRGVNTSGVLSTLLERRLVKIAGRKPVVGRPFLYATTREFLIRFGLKDLNDLPKMEDMADLLGFEAPAGLSEAVPRDVRLPLDDGEELRTTPAFSAPLSGESQEPWQGAPGEGEAVPESADPNSQPDATHSGHDEEDEHGARPGGPRIH
jgi:segregation and condensation protein B